MKQIIIAIILTILIALAVVAEVSFLRYTTEEAHQQELMDNRPTY